MVTFNTKREAVAAGYWQAAPARTLPDGHTIRDTSGPGEFGYAFTLFDPAGQAVAEAVPVWLDAERNKAGRQGAICMMFPALAVTVEDA